ncbi:MAG: copper amine oxidase N-terminal domain-containing protein [Epulopiscium sp.]|nr:copper amine oxidase N-terminal domain-containing protein [Candidatus Epulonipiscium sp.]
MLKRKLAALLAGAMVLTSLPMVSFAATDNRVDSVPTVKKDTVFCAFDGDGSGTDGYKAPILRITAKDEGIDEGSTFRLIFENAEWKGLTTANPDSPLTQDQLNNAAGLITYEKLTKTVVEFKVKNVVGNNQSIQIPLAVKVTGTGEAKVTVDPMNTKVSAGTYVFANAGDGATKTTIADTADFPDELNLEAIMIDELKAMSLPRNTDLGNNYPNNPSGDKKIKLTAPRGFEWVATVTGSTSSYVTLTGAGAFAGNVEERGEVFPTYGGGQQDKEVLEIYYDNKTGTTSTIGSLILSGLKLVATEDADLGDVYVEVSGDDITTEKIKVGTYVEYGVKITVEDKERELISGRYYAADENDDYKLLKLTIEEGVVDSWWSQRNTTIKFPKGIKVREAKIDDLSEVTGIAKKATLNNSNFKVNKDRDLITLNNLDVNPGKKGKVVLLIWVSIEADYEGDITAVVGGPALPEETEVVLGKAFKAVNATFKATELQIGYKEVAVSDIEITEAKAGALVVGETLYLKPEYMSFDDDFAIEVEVTEGDLQIGDVDYVKGAIAIDIKRASKEASTIKISGAGVYVDRTVAEGSYALEVYGEAFLQNNKDLTGVEPAEGFKTKSLDFKEFIKVVTPAPHKGEAGGAAITASFTVGSSEYTVGDQVATADAAPYIQDGRTMVPVKYVAYALGIDPQQVQWDQASKTVTIYGDKVVNITIGSKSIVVGGTPVPMDTEAVVKDGRTFVPIAFAARALGVPYRFDDATKTVTFN